MRRITLAAAGITAVLSAVACSASGSPGTPAVTPATTARATPAVTDGSIQIAVTSYPAGPFRITPTYCGRFSRAQRDTYGTTAKGGFLYRFTNTSDSITGSPEVSVNFLTGSNVTGNNVTGGQVSIGPGQSAAGEVDAVGDGGGNLTFAQCEVEFYNIVTSGGGAQDGDYAP